MVLKISFGFCYRPIMNCFKDDFNFIPIYFTFFGYAEY